MADSDKNYGIDSVVAIPLENWSLDLITPNGECVKKDGQCIQEIYKADTDVDGVPLIYPGSEVTPNDKNALYIDENIPIPTINGALPKAGAYVLVADYYQPDMPGKCIPPDVKMKYSYDKMYHVMKIIPFFQNSI